MPRNQMRRLPPAGTAVCAAIALAIPTAAGATTVPAAGARTAGKPKPTTGFTPVTIPLKPDHIASTTDGVVYVSGRTDDGKISVIRLTRTNKTTKVETVAYTDDGTLAPELYAAGDHVYAYRSTERSGQVTRLFDIVGLTSTPLTLPTGPGVYGGSFAADSVGSLWFSGWGAGHPLSFHGDGKTWNQLPGEHSTTGSYHSYARDGHLYVLGRAYWPDRAASVWADHWDGATWTNRIDLGHDFAGFQQYELHWTFATATDYTRWGYSSLRDEYGKKPTVPLHGTCTHVVNGATSDCPAPPWGVSAAVRRGDGSVVHGGFDGKGKADTFVEGGFARVPTPGAQPVAIPGDNQTRVQELAAAPTGSTVWAITSTDGGTDWWPGKATTLQVLATRKQHKPKNPPNCP